MFNKRNIMDWLIITLGVIIVASAVFFFMMPLNITVGSGTALAIVLSNFIPLPASVITMVLNVAFCSSAVSLAQKPCIAPF